MPAEINCSIEDRDNVKIVHLSGQLCSANQNEFVSLLESLLAQSNVIVNLTNLTTITVCGFNVLKEISNFAKKKKKRLMILGAQDSLLQLINITNTYDLILINSVDEGLKKLEYYL